MAIYKVIFTATCQSAKRPADVLSDFIDALEGSAISQIYVDRKENEDGSPKQSGGAFFYETTGTAELEASSPRAALLGVSDAIIQCTSLLKAYISGIGVNEVILEE